MDTSRCAARDQFFGAYETIADHLCAHGYAVIEAWDAEAPARAKNKVIVTHAMQMSVLHGLKVFTFVVAGFPFLLHWKIMLVLIVASAAGSYVGSLCRNRIPEKLGVIALKTGITFFSSAVSPAAHHGHGTVRRQQSASLSLMRIR